MEPERKDTILIVIAVILGLVAVTAIALVLMKGGDDSVETPAPIPKEETPTVPEKEEVVVPREAPEASAPEEDVVEIQAEEPEPLSDDMEARIQAIADRIGRGEITREEGQRQINQLLGI